MICAIYSACTSFAAIISTEELDMDEKTRTYSDQTLQSARQMEITAQTLIELIESNFSLEYEL